jgi:hypothetical protein
MRQETWLTDDQGDKQSDAKGEADSSLGADGRVAVGLPGEDATGGGTTLGRA